MNADREPALTPVDVFAPWAGEKERALRLRIHKAQSVAAARAAREPNSRVRALYYLAAELALDWVFHRVDDLGDLERILRALAQLFIAADNIFQLEGDGAR
jgi:hypothetical protein